MKQVNLKAIQSLHEIIDTVNLIYNRAYDPTFISTKNQSRIELQQKYNIEFLVNSTNPDSNNAAAISEGMKKKQKHELVSTRRSVELIFTEKECNLIHSVNGKTGKYSVVAAKQVKYKAMRQIIKLLRVAGLKPPDLIQEEVMNYQNRPISGIDDDSNDGDDEDENNDLNMYERMILEELELDNENDSNDRIRFGRNFDYSTQNHHRKQQQHQSRPKTKYERSRDRFMKNIDWKEHRRLYDEALEDMKRDIATDGLIKMNLERKQRLVSDVISRVRLHDGNDGSDTNATNATNNHESMDPLEQLIAIRRMSLLFNDNFEELQMEDMGKIWESLFIVLTPERAKGRGEKGAPFSRRKRLREGRESGFKFAFHDTNKLTVYVPIDFLDDELIGELKTHLGDFYDLCVGDVLAQFLPANYKDYEGCPKVEVLNTM